MLRHHHSAELRQRLHSDDKLPPKPLEIQRPAPDIMWAPTEQLQLVEGILFKALIWIHLNPEIRLICSNRVRHIHCTYCSLTMSTLRTTNSWIHQMKIDNAHLPTLKKVEYKRMLFFTKKPPQHSQYILKSQLIYGCQKFKIQTECVAENKTITEPFSVAQYKHRKKVLMH